MSDKIKVLIVDDEALARADLRFMLSAMPEIGNITDCSNAAEALSLLQDDVFDCIFLDIQMPGLNGLKAVRIINQLNNPPKIVFASAFDEHAVKAFELDAVDYLVKPFNNRRLAQAVQKIIRVLNSSQPENKLPTSIGTSGNSQKAHADSHFKKIPVEKGEGVMLVNLNEVYYIAANNDRVEVHTGDEVYACRFSLSELDSRLNSQGFIRVHRGYLVNMEHILELQPFLNGTYNLMIDDKKKSIIPVSRSRVKLLRNLIGV